MKRMIFAVIALVIALRQAAAAEQQLIFDYDAVAACLDDAQTVCKGIAPGEGRIEVCLQQNASKLSPGCAKALARIIAAQSPAPHR